MFADLTAAWRALRRSPILTVEPLHDSIVQNHRLALLALFAATAFVLLVGCANVANLLLARGFARRGELAVRTALGATRIRIVRLLFSETLLLALPGAATGCALGTRGCPIHEPHCREKAQRE